MSMVLATLHLLFVDVVVVHYNLEVDGTIRVTKKKKKKKKHHLMFDTMQVDYLLMCHVHHCSPHLPE
jgi:hypothetical protein